MCEFCDEFETIKYIENRSEIIKEGFYYVYKVKRISVAMKDGKERGYSSGAMLPLNFCPECGKKLVFDETRRSPQMD